MHGFSKTARSSFDFHSTRNTRRDLPPYQKSVPFRQWNPAQIHMPIKNRRIWTSLDPEMVTFTGIETLKFKPQESNFIRLIKPCFPFVQNWTLIDKCCTTLGMLCIIRALYFIPLYGIKPINIPEGVVLSTMEQRMLEKLFMAENGVPLSIALLGISPIVISGFLIHLWLNVPAFHVFPLFRNLINRKAMGTLTQEEMEKTAFLTALVIAILMAIQKASVLRAFAPNAILFFPNVVADMVAALTITKFCCNIIQKDGLGEGTGFLLLALTLSGFWKKLCHVGNSFMNGSIPLWKLSLVLVCYLGIVTMCTLFNETHVRIPLTDYGLRGRKAPVEAKSHAMSSDFMQNKMPYSVTSAPYFSLSLSQSAVTALFISSGVSWWLNLLLSRWPSIYKAVQNQAAQTVMFASIAFFVSLVPIGYTVKTISELLSRLEKGIKGVIPGDQTEVHLKQKLFESSLFGAFCLFFVIIGCMSVDYLCSQWLGTPIGALNLILLVAVISSAFKTMETYMDQEKVEQVLHKEKDILKIIRDTRI